MTAERRWSVESHDEGFVQLVIRSPADDLAAIDLDHAELLELIADLADAATGRTS